MTTTKVTKSSTTKKNPTSGELITKPSVSHDRAETHYPGADGTPVPASMLSSVTISPAKQGPILRDPVLMLLAKSVDDIEGVRKATANRVRALTSNGFYVANEFTGEKEWQKGFSLTEENPAVKFTRYYFESVKQLEKAQISALEKHMKNHWSWEWVKAQKGVGAKQSARLIASLGDPYWNEREDLNRPRTVSELWAYCGYSVINGAAQKRTKGQKSNWSSDAKMRAYLVAESCKMQIGNEEKGVEAGHYRKIYDATKLRLQGSFHSTECVRCGKKGSPAPAGSELNKGHIEARAVRAISKEILKDLWILAKAEHEKP